MLGTVISPFENAPTTKGFHFIIDKSANVRKGKFIQLQLPDGKLIGRVSEIYRANKYYMQPETVKEYESSGKGISEIFPSNEWEYLVAQVESLGVFDGNSFQPSTYPPSPGQKVFEPEQKILEGFFGIDENGLEIGEMSHHKIKVKLNMTKLFLKHLAILAISGAGKSFLTAVLLEEMLKKEPKESPGIILIDTHGEYTGFAEDKNYINRTRVFSINDIRIGFSNLPESAFADFGLTPTQERALIKVLGNLKGNYSITEAIDAIEHSDINQKTKDPILGTLYNLRRTGLFGINDYPPLDEIVKQGQLSIIDLSSSTNLSTKRMMVAYFARKLFNTRRSGTIPPFIIILEEAHQYIPEKVKKEHAMSKSIMETIAREGRKFQASICLISQRPVHLSTTVLSQCNTKIILRVVNPNDLAHIEESSEAMAGDLVKQITDLPVGQGYIIGEAVNFPLLVKIRKRLSKESRKGKSIEDACREFYEKVERKRKDSKAFI